MKTLQDILDTTYDWGYQDSLSGAGKHKPEHVKGSLSDIQALVAGCMPEKNGLLSRREDSTEWSTGYDDAIDQITTALQQAGLLKGDTDGNKS